MALIETFPGPSGVVDSTELRKDLAGLLVRNLDGSPRAGVFERDPASPIGAARTADMRIDLRAFNAALVRNGGPLFTQNTGVDQSPVLTVPSSNQIIHVVYARQNEAASPYGDANNSPVFGFVSSGQSANPQLADALALLPAGALPLVSVQVPSTAVTTSSSGVIIKDIVPFTALAGGAVPFPTLASLKAWTTALPLQPATVFNDGTNNGLYLFTGGTWMSLMPGSSVVIPTNVTNGSLSDTGTVTYTGVTSVQLDGVFTSQFDNYLIVIDNTAKSAAANTALQLTKGGALAPSSVYAAVRGYDNGTSRPVSTIAAGSLAAIELEAGTQGVTHIEVMIFGPAKAFATQLRAEATAFPYSADITGSHATVDSYDGFRLSPNPSGTFTGTVTVYGLRK